MSTWTLEVRDAMNVATITSATNGILDGTRDAAVRIFDPPIVVPPGSSRVLNLYVRQATLSIPPRAIVLMTIDTHPVFWGPAVVVPAITSPGAGPFDEDRDALERVTVVGGEQLLKDSVISTRLFDEETDVSAIALELCELYAHPALTVDEVNFPETGMVLSLFYAPEKTLYDALVELAGTVPGGAVTYVDALGAIHFRAND